MTHEIFPTDLDNLLIDWPEKRVQVRIVSEIKTLIDKGMDIEKAVDWVFSQKQSYIDNPDFTLLPVESSFSE